MNDRQRRQRSSEQALQRMCPHNGAINGDWNDGWRYTCALCGALMSEPKVTK